VTSSPNPSVYGQPVTLTATVTGASPTGTVTFTTGTTGATTLCSAAPLSNSIATCTTSALPVGGDTVTTNTTALTAATDTNGTASCTATFNKGFAGNIQAFDYLVIFGYTATYTPTPGYTGSTANARIALGTS
jgi:hypothetical protein